MLVGALAGRWSLRAPQRRCPASGGSSRWVVAISAQPETGVFQSEETVDQTDWYSLLPKHVDLEKWEDGEKWILVKDGKMAHWKKEREVGIYRYTDGGYESKDENGNWVNYAQMPQDVSHLTDAQRERLIKELRGEVKVSMSDGDLDFVPKAQVPPLEKWPFHEVAITDKLKATDEELKDWRQLEMSDDLGRAFFLASRWKGSNEARRHLGYNVNDEIEDIANMNGSVLALRCLVEQLKRGARFRKQPHGQPEPSDANRLRNLRINGLLGTTKGSAMAMWMYSAEKRRVLIDICIGDDCMDQGPYAEETLIRHLATKGAQLGAVSIWCRTRRTESGRVFVPKYYPKLGFTAVPYDLQEEEEWDVTGLKMKKEIVETVPGLNLWMSTRQLERHMEAANTWCYEMGAADINEVAENKLGLIAYLGEELTEEERDRLLQY